MSEKVALVLVYLVSCSKHITEKKKLGRAVQNYTKSREARADKGWGRVPGEEWEKPNVSKGGRKKGT